MKDFKREDFFEKDVETMQNELQSEIVQYAEEITSYTKEQLEEEEKVLLEKMAALDKSFNEIEYTLPDKVPFDGKDYSKNEIANKISYFLGKMDVKWSYTLGLYQLVKMWRNKDLQTISYKAYDSTLRTLDQVTYKGYDEWRDILIINDYFAVNHVEYTKDTSLVYYYSSLHNAILDRLNPNKQEAQSPMQVPA